MPRVSVAIPSYNLGRYIAETIRGVLAQSFQDFEILIEDDFSTDDSLSVIQPFLTDPRVKLTLKNRNDGANVTTNNMLKRASGDYVALCAADDVWSDQEKLAKQVAYLDANPACGIVFGHPRFVGDDGQPVRYADESVCSQPNMSREQWRLQFRKGNRLFISTSMYRRSLHAEIGFFAPDLPVLADMEFYVRILKKHDLHVLQEPLTNVRMRFDQSNLSAPTAKNLAQHSDDLEVVIARHYRSGHAERAAERAKVEAEFGKLQTVPHLREAKFMIATPFYEVKGYSPYIRSLVRSVEALTIAKIDYEFLELSGDSYVWRARNTIAKHFLESDCTHLVFIDSDEAWDLESFLRLLKADVDVVGSVYPVKNAWEHFGVTIYTNQDGTPLVNPETGLIRGQKVPTGFMKIRREVFLKLKAHDPENWYWSPHNGINQKIHNFFGHRLDEHVIYGEDISFCRRCEDAGIELWVEPRATIEHWGVQCWKGNYHEFLCRQPGGSQDPKRAVNDSVSSEAA